MSSSLLNQSKARLKPCEAKAIEAFVEQGGYVKRCKNGEHSLTSESFVVAPFRKRRSKDDKLAAARMRAEGATLDEIAGRYRVARNSLLSWISDVATDEQRAAIDLVTRRERAESLARYRAQLAEAKKAK